MRVCLPCRRSTRPMVRGMRRVELVCAVIPRRLRQSAFRHIVLLVVFHPGRAPTRSELPGGAARACARAASKTEGRGSRFSIAATFSPAKQALGRRPDPGGAKRGNSDSIILALCSRFVNAKSAYRSGPCKLGHNASCATIFCRHGTRSQREPSGLVAPRDTRSRRSSQALEVNATRSCATRWVPPPISSSRPAGR